MTDVAYAVGCPIGAMPPGMRDYGTKEWQNREEGRREMGRAGLRDAVLGAAIGDALGVPYEFRPRHTFRCRGMVGGGTHGQPAGTWSDDTAMMLATCDSIRHMGHVDTDDMRERFLGWLRHGAYTPDGRVFDVGGTTSRALRSGVGCDGERDNGNGSLMRIAPLAFCDATDDEVREVSAITHAHPTSTGACVELVHLLRALADEPAAAISDLRSEFAGTRRVSIRSGGYVLDTLRAAKWCLARTGGYAECVLEAVDLGGDTDTTACVAGALAGTAYGKESIPAEWVSALRGQEVLESALF